MNILVTSATGQQGLATTRALLDAGANVRAIVRDPTKPAAQHLASLGVTLFKGTLNDTDVFRTAAQGCQGLFLNLVAWPTDPDPGARARGILQACKEAGVGHVVISTSGWAGSREKWIKASTKATTKAAEGEEDDEGYIVGFNKHEAEAEDAVRKAGFKHYTILRPFWFHANYTLPSSREFYPELATKGRIVHSYNPGTIFPHVNVKDIGRFAALALGNPEKFDGKEIEFASENLGIEEVKGILERATGREIEVVYRKPEEVEEGSLLLPWHEWANKVDLTVDVERFEREYPEFKFTKLEEHLRDEKGKIFEP